MIRCDFSSVISILRQYISEDRGLNQVDILYELFASFIEDAGRGKDAFYFDNGLVCRWMNGAAKISPRISAYYMQPQNIKKLVADLQANILPLLYDEAAALQALQNLLLQDVGISEQKKQELQRAAINHAKMPEATFIAKLLVFGMERTFVKRDIKNKAMITAGVQSPVVLDIIFGAEMPKPCAHFCGRDAEVNALHEQLVSHDKLFVSGIAGIGKSELVKQYAKQHKKDYTNILYLAYSGDLKQDIINLDFADDVSTDTEQQRFQKHNRFLRTLQGDSLLVIDNFNVALWQDEILSVVLKYRCRVLITTRCAVAEYPVLQVAELSQLELFQLVSCFYTSATEHQPLVEQVIALVHGHTFAVELAARLLETGILEPLVLLEKLRNEKTALDSTDKIGITKDGKKQKATYYQHIHLLFSLFALTQEQVIVLQNLSLMPYINVPKRLFAEWLSLQNLNAVNDLIELGLVQSAHGAAISLHPVISEIALADTKPSTENCRNLLTNLQSICVQHGTTVSYSTLLFNAIESIMKHIQKEDISFYLLFLGEVFLYMEQYGYSQGMLQILEELAPIFKDETIGTEQERARWYDLQAAYQHRILEECKKAITLEKKALACITEVTVHNARLVANIYANIGGLYRQEQQYADAQKYMEQSVEVLQTYGLAHSLDAIPQLCNYAVLLGETRQGQKGLSILRELTRWLRDTDMTQNASYAMVMQVMGYLYLMEGIDEQAKSCFTWVLHFYQQTFADNPIYIAKKREEIFSYITAVYGQVNQSFAFLLEE